MHVRRKVFLSSLLFSMMIFFSISQKVEFDGNIIKNLIISENVHVSTMFFYMSNKI